MESVRRGETLVVVDADRAIAKLIPADSFEPDLFVHPARGCLRDVPLLAPCPLPFDVVEVLLEDRKDRL